MLLYSLRLVHTFILLCFDVDTDADVDVNIDNHTKQLLESNQACEIVGWACCASLAFWLLHSLRIPSLCVTSLSWALFHFDSDYFVGHPIASCLVTSYCNICCFRKKKV